MPSLPKIALVAGLCTCCALAWAGESASAPAHAGLGATIKHDAKAVGHDVATGAKHVGHAIKKTASSFGHAVAQGATETGHAIKKGVKSVGAGVAEGVDALKQKVDPDQPASPAPIEQGTH